uniref:hypothetical protein n=1 Tax=Enterocloster clostridioformis TaxID=1531 RepID=UPI0025A5D6D5
SVFRRWPVTAPYRGEQTTRLTGGHDYHHTILTGDIIPMLINIDDIKINPGRRHDESHHRGC